MESSKQKDIERRRLQNRLAQRRFRQRHRSHSQQKATTGSTEQLEQPRGEGQTNTDAQHKSTRLHHSDISPASDGPPSPPEFFAIAFNSDLLQGDPPFSPAAPTDPDKIPLGWCHLGRGSNPMIEGITSVDFSSGSEGTGTPVPPSTIDARRDSGGAAGPVVPGPGTGRKWQSPLHMAAEKGRNRIVCMLLQHNNVDCNEGDSEGLTPLMHATINGFEDVARSLLAHGARVGAADNQRQSALHWAIRHRREALLQLLLEHCAGAGERERSVIDAYDLDGRTPLHTAIDMGFEAGVQVLLRFGADVKYKAGVS